MKANDLNLCKAIILFALMMPLTIIAQQPEVFSIASIKAKQGSKVSGKIMVEKGVDEGTFIPITIIHGTKPGPVLTLCAGIHGTEYVPIVVGQKFIREINPEELSGTLIVVHIANIPSFTGRAVYSSPIDKKNLNRVFPGKKDGTISERIAYVLSQEIIKKSDYYIDMHSGEITEELVNFIYFYYDCPDSTLSAKSKMLAQAIGNHYLIPDKSIPDDGTSLAVYSDQVAIRNGIPAITLEWGDRGNTDLKQVEFAKKGLFNVMRTIGLLEGEIFVNEHPVYLLDQIFIRSEYNGIAYTFVKKGQYVVKGTRVAYVTDYLGNTLKEYYAPMDGIIVLVLVTPTINKGEVIYNIARPSDQF